MDAINNGSVTVHSSRFPMSSTDLRIMLNNIQFSLGLTIGLQAEWSLQADQKLMELLAKPKRVKRKAAVINAIADAPQDLQAIRDELTNDNDIAHPEVAVDEPADTNNKPAAKDTKAVQDELTSDNDIAHPEVTVDEPAEANNEPPAKANAKNNPEANDDSDSNSWYSSSSSSSLRVPPNISYNDRMTWPSDFADAYTCGLDLLEASGNNKQKHNASVNVLRAIVTAKEVSHMKVLSATLSLAEHTLLHTDSARAYKSKTPGVLHASVVHKKRRVWVGGRWVWEPPTYVKIKKVILPNQKRLTVKVGTQVVDRAWRFVKSRLTLNQNSKVGSTTLISQVRSAQYEYWNRGRDMWERTGELLSWHMSQIMTK
ncbi:unnamed protein product [Symbiodinium sp. KB8]|nr:unnamed protein product [Symbiodinium sp. KB8]